MTVTQYAGAILSGVALVAALGCFAAMIFTWAIAWREDRSPWWVRLMGVRGVESRYLTEAGQWAKDRHWMAVCGLILSGVLAVAGTFMLHPDEFHDFLRPPLSRTLP